MVENLKFKFYKSPSRFFILSFFRRPIFLLNFSRKSSRFSPWRVFLLFLGLLFLRSSSSSAHSSASSLKPSSSSSSSWTTPLLRSFRSWFGCGFLQSQGNNFRRKSEEISNVFDTFIGQGIIISSSAKFKCKIIFAF